MPQTRGFTLVELVMVIALAGIVAVMIGTVLSSPLEGFVAQSRRAGLVDLAATALNRLSRDVRLAVPNSVRLSADGLTLETLNILSAGRYRPNRVGGEGLRFAAGTDATCTAMGNRCDAFQVLDPALNIAGARWLVLYNIGVTSGGNPVTGNLWAGVNPGVISPNAVTFATPGGAPAGETLVVLNNFGGGFSFAYASPQRRFYFADQVIGYRCDLPGRQLLRYTGIALSVAAPNVAPAGAQVLASNVSACTLTYQPGSTQRAGLLTIGLGLTDPASGESIQLLQQVHVDNAP
ncbi:type II secretion system protein J [Pseudomonas sp. 2FG]|uniref:PulJ/GspJ family protein n=1 Tax=Pseudomonas sp. 2FG TaxID=2502191 RepID=UPI0010F67DB9|nr:type II secretion system protein [Pseudomonas sp. 2FG]